MRRRGFIQLLGATALAVALRPLPSFGLGQPNLVRPLPEPEPEVYLGLYTAEGEVSGNGYARQRVVDNREIKFPQASSGWGVVTGVLLFDGSIVMKVPLKVPFSGYAPPTIQSGDVLSANLGGLLHDGRRTSENN